MDDINKIHELTKKLAVLYVEDNDSVRSTTLRTLNKFFGEVYVAEDGAAGLELFHGIPVDLVITDIEMPNMNGLDMIKNIRIKNPEIPIVITTAFDNQQYFIRSIDLRVDKYLIKPVEFVHAKEVFFSIAKMIDNRKKAKEYEIHLRQEEINRLSQNIVTQITNSYQYPCIVYTDNEIRYVNSEFSSLFDSKMVEDFLSNKIDTASLFDKRKGFMGSLEEYDEKNPLQNRVSVSKRKGRKIYRLSKNEIYIDKGDKKSFIYLFMDITLEEYQKVKLKTYAEKLEDLVFYERYRKAKKTPPLENTQPAKVKKIAIQKEPHSGKKHNKEKLLISDQENELLRHSHIYATDAKTYVAELDSEVLRDLDELDDLDLELGESITLFQEKFDINSLKQITAQLERYAHQISTLFEFEDLALAIRSLCGLLKSIDLKSLDDTTMSKTALLLDGMKLDLSSWRKMIFLDQSALDIHYLDSSFFSSCLQIELLISNKVKDEEEDDLILF